MASYTGNLSIARNMVRQKIRVKKIQPYHSASIKSEPTIAEQKQPQTWQCIL